MSRFTLLLADDSVTIQKVVNLTFSGEGIEVVSVSDGNSAIDVLREDLPDLVMADVNIPGVNGYEICEMVKSMDTTREIPVILLVGSFEPFDEEEAKRVGADAHLTKPFESIAALVEMVTEFLSGAPEETEEPRFDDTVEYPPDHEMVVSASSIPFAGGFEDDTIEAEQVSRPSAEAREESGDSFEQVEGLETFESGDESGYGQEEGDRSGQFSPEINHDYETPDEPSPAEDQPSYYYSDVQEEAVEREFESGDAEPEYEEAAGKESSEFGGWDEPQSEYEGTSAAPAFEESEPEMSDDEPEEAPASGFYYREETYSEASYFETDVDDDYERTFEESVGDRGEPIPLGPAEEDDNRTVDLGAVTVELDDSDLLELPVDESGHETETSGSEVFTGTEEQLHQTMRDHSPSAGMTGDETAEIEGRFTGDIPDELVNEIARRVVERLSEKAVREIAWEVVPEMAELIIKKMTEQKLNE